MADKNMKTSEAQREASRRYREKNKEKTRIQGYRRTAKMFVREHATLEDIEELEQLIEERKKALSE